MGKWRESERDRKRRRGGMLRSEIKKKKKNE